MKENSAFNNIRSVFGWFAKRLWRLQCIFQTSSVPRCSVPNPNALLCFLIIYCVANSPSLILGLQCSSHLHLDLSILQALEPKNFLIPLTSFLCRDLTPTNILKSKKNINFFVGNDFVMCLLDLRWFLSFK